ncbi:MAG: hypothetical protein WD512_12125 [Candidatus Paceibacterota bacterium]
MYILMELLHLFVISSILLLILINVYEYFKPKMREGATNQTDTTNVSYQDYNELQTKDPMFLAIKNAANISYMKSQLDELTGIKQQILDLSNNVYTNAQQIDQIQQAVQDQASAVTGGALQDTNGEVTSMDETPDETTNETSNETSNEETEIQMFK